MRSTEMICHLQSGFCLALACQSIELGKTWCNDRYFNPLCIQPHSGRSWATSMSVRLIPRLSIILDGQPGWNCGEIWLSHGRSAGPLGCKFGHYTVLVHLQLSTHLCTGNWIVDLWAFWILTCWDLYIVGYIPVIFPCEYEGFSSTDLKESGRDESDIRVIPLPSGMIRAMR